jgi:hypothetical protein
MGSGRFIFWKTEIWEKVTDGWSVRKVVKGMEWVKVWCRRLCDKKKLYIYKRIDLKRIVSIRRLVFRMIS